MTSRCGSPRPCIYADVRDIDDVTAIEGHRGSDEDRGVVVAGGRQTCGQAEPVHCLAVGREVPAHVGRDVLC